MENSYFSKLKILDFTGELGPYAAKMFAGMGAEVIHIEPLGGDPLRQVGPFYKNVKTRDSSLPYCFFNTGKRGLALNLDQSDGQDVLRRLCASAIGTLGASGVRCRTPPRQ